MFLFVVLFLKTTKMLISFNEYLSWFILGPVSSALTSFTVNAERDESNNSSNNNTVTSRRSINMHAAHVYLHNVTDGQRDGKFPFKSPKWWKFP